jgi:hypothetical protein
MIRTIRGEFVATCTECGEEHFGGTQEDFRAFVEELKAEGWKIRKEGDTWEHICPECSEE